MYRLKIASGPRAGQAIPLKEAGTRFGGEAVADVDVKLDELGQHDQIEIHYDEQNQRLMLQNQGQTQLWVNNQSDQGPHIALSGGDEIRVGTLRLVVQAPGLRPQSVLTKVPERRPIPAWTWVLVAAIAGSGIVAMAVFITARIN